MGCVPVTKFTYSFMQQMTWLHVTQTHCVYTSIRSLEYARLPTSTVISVMFCLHVEIHSLFFYFSSRIHFLRYQRLSWREESLFWCIDLLLWWKISTHAGTGFPSRSNSCAVGTGTEPCSFQYGTGIPRGLMILLGPAQPVSARYAQKGLYRREDSMFVGFVEKIGQGIQWIGFLCSITCHWA